MSEAVEIIPLFPTEPEADTKDARGFPVPWSYTRRSLLEQCPRHYYYEYYGASARSAADDPLKTKLRFLKDLQNRHAHSGRILHAVIARLFRLAQTGELWTGQQLEAWALRQFDRDVAYARLRVGSTESEGQDAEAVLLREFYYRQPDAVALYAEMRTRLVDALRAFRNHEAFEWCRAAGGDPRALIEATVSIQDFPCRLEGRVDLAYCGEDGVNIVDWKIGSDDSVTESLQLVAYGIWALTEFECSLDRVHVYKAYLGSRRLVASEITPQLLRAGRARITQDAVRMRFLHRYGQNATADAFTPCAQRKVCSLCPYQGVCPVGKEF